MATAKYWNGSSWEQVSYGNLASLGDAKGDLIGFSADNTPVRIPAAAGDGYGLVSDSSQSGGVAWTERTTPYYAKMYLQNSGTPTHNNTGNWQKVGSGGGTSTWVSSFDVRPTGVTAQVDTSNKRINIQKTGVYRIQGRVYLAGVTSGKIVFCGLYANGTAVAMTGTAGGSSWDGMAECNATVALTSGDYVELYCYQNYATIAYNVGATWTNEILVEYIGPAS